MTIPTFFNNTFHFFQSRSSIILCNLFDIQTSLTLQAKSLICLHWNKMKRIIWDGRIVPKLYIVVIHPLWIFSIWINILPYGNCNRWDSYVHVPLTCHNITCSIRVPIRWSVLQICHSRLVCTTSHNLSIYASFGVMWQDKNGRGFSCWLR